MDRHGDAGVGDPSGAVSLDRGVEARGQAGEGRDRRQAIPHGRGGEAQQGTVHADVLPSRQPGGEARGGLDQAGDAATDARVPGIGVRDARVGQAASFAARGVAFPGGGVGAPRGRPGVDDVALALLTGFGGACLALPLAVRAAGPLRLLDRPTARSSHARAVPRAGGLPLAAGLAVAALALLGHGEGARLSAWLLPLGAPALGFLLLGLADDRWRLGARPKFLAQAVLAAGAVGLGWRWQGAAAEPFPVLAFGALTPAMTWLWIVAVVTLVNFMDGIDLITCATLVVPLALGAGAGAGALDGAVLAACVGATLALAWGNVTPARTFPGDGATHLLGFLVATLPLGVTAGGAVARPLPWAWAAAPLLPAVLDVALGLAAKRRRGLPWSAAHREHLHQRLTRAGWTHAASALRYGALAALGAVLAVEGFPRLGVAVGGVLAAAVLAWHLATARRRTRDVAWRRTGGGEVAGQNG